MNTKYLTKAHQKNSEAATKQIKEWKKSPTNFEKLLKQMKENAMDKKSLYEKESKGNIFILNGEQKNVIKEARKQIENGLTITNEQADAEIDKLFNN